MRWRSNLVVRIFSLTCREFIEFLGAYLDGELPNTQRREFDWHLKLCRSCRAYLQTYRHTIRLEELTRSQLDRDVPDTVPEELVRAILAARGVSG